MSSRVEQKATAREKAAAMRAEQERSERRRRLLIAGSAVGVVLVIVAALVLAKISGAGSSPASTPAASGQASPAVVAALSVPPATFDSVGVGSAKGGQAKIDAPALKDGEKAKVLYVGAEFCPFCAAERWPMAVALSRFGSFSGLGSTASASADVYPDTATLSFHGATYSSPYVSFTGVETTSNEPASGGGYEPLDTLSDADQKLFDTYNKPPYVTGQAGGIPFIDIGGTRVSSGATFSPEVLAGKTHEEIAAALKDPKSPIAQAIDGSANLITAAICESTGDKPAEVCTSAGVTAAATQLASQ